MQEHWASSANVNANTGNGNRNSFITQHGEMGQVTDPCELTHRGPGPELRFAMPGYKQMAQLGHTHDFRKALAFRGGTTFICLAKAQFELL